jgi:5'-3' exonuclease
MGIPSYFSYVLKNHKRIIKKLEHVKCHRLMIDANSFIYDSINEFGPNNVYENVYKKITDLANKLNITGLNSVYVTFDGVVPVAKMKQQKERRYKSWLTKQLLNKSGWNTNAITPGTDFMNELDNYLKPKFNEIGYLYSGPNEAGEGEHKIFDYLRKYPTNRDNIIIYGLDADLIMLSLIHIQSRNLFLYRETKHFSYLSQIDINKDYLFDMNEMAKQISYYLYGNTQLKQKAVMNYCFLCFLCGNDFLPHFASINIRNHGINYLLNTFKTKLKDKDLVIGNNIQWETLKELFTELSYVENDLIIENIKWKQGMKYFPKNQEDELNFLPLKDVREDYLIDNINEYYTFLFSYSGDTETTEKKMCNIYLKMLEWTWNYYNGICKDYYIYYPYHLAPLFSSLKNETIMNNVELIDKIDNKEFPNVITQLTYVLPYVDINDLMTTQDKQTNQTNQTTEELLLKIKNKYPNITEMSYKLHYDFCKFFWESHVEFNYLNMREYNDFITTITK